MKISELIEKLEQLRDQVGDVEVEARNTAGDYDTAEDAEIVNVACKANDPKWRVYIEV
jgi:hypothetical protein